VYRGHAKAGNPGRSKLHSGVSLANLVGLGLRVVRAEGLNLRLICWCGAFLYQTWQAGMGYWAKHVNISVDGKCKDGVVYIILAFSIHYL